MNLNPGVNNESFCGLIGIFLFVPLFISSLYQLWISYQRLHSYLHIKVQFYFALTFYSFLESIYFINLMINDRVTKWPQCLHIFGLVSYVYAFSSVIYLWGSTMSFEKKFVYPYYAGVIVVGLNFIIGVVGIVCVLISPTFDKFQENYWYINLLIIVMHSVCLMLLAFSMLWYGINLQLKLASSTVKSATGKNTKLAIILRINGMLSICNVCFFLRIIALGLLCYDVLMDATYTDDNLLGIGWYLMSNWIPTLIPAVTLLIMLRVKDTSRSSKHIRTIEKQNTNWRSTDASNGAGASIVGKKDGIDHRQSELSDMNEEDEEDVSNNDIETSNPVHDNFPPPRNSPYPQKSRASSGQGSFHIDSKSNDGDDIDDYDDFN